MNAPTRDSAIRTRGLTKDYGGGRTAKADSARFEGDKDLEQIHDGTKTVGKGGRGLTVTKLQQALIARVTRCEGRDLEQLRVVSERRRRRFEEQPCDSIWMIEGASPGDEA